MPKDRDQLTPDDPDDQEHLQRTRGQGAGGSGEDVLPGDRSAPGSSPAGPAEESSARGDPRYRH